jgi:hypothetical protein
MDEDGGAPSSDPSRGVTGMRLLVDPPVELAGLLSLSRDANGRLGGEARLLALEDMSFLNILCTVFGLEEAAATTLLVVLLAASDEFDARLLELGGIVPDLLDGKATCFVIRGATAVVVVVVLGDEEGEDEAEEIDFTFGRGKSEFVSVVGGD